MRLTHVLNAAITAGCAVMLVIAGLGPVAVAAQGPAAPASAAKPEAKNATPAAKVGADVISLDEVEQALGAQLAELEQQRHALLSQKLDELIGDRLLAQEAAKQGVSVEQLLKTRVYANAPDVTDAEVTAFIAQNRARLPRGVAEAELKLKVRDYLRSQKVGEQREDYVQSLRAKAQVTTYLQEPAVPRVQVSTDKGFVHGAPEARVTIVEFTDFQCPFCKTVTPTLRQLMNDYRGKVKLVFRDFPIAGLHPAAPKAHEAARCAAAQGKFWEYHDVLFERSPQHTLGELKQYAQELKLDAKAFGECLDSGRFQAEVNSDVEEGTRLGVSGTPTFFINGRLLVGARPLADFKKVIDGELK